MPNFTIDAKLDKHEGNLRLIASAIKSIHIGSVRFDQFGEVVDCHIELDADAVNGMKAEDTKNRGHFVSETPAPVGRALFLSNISAVLGDLRISNELTINKAGDMLSLTIQPESAEILKKLVKKCHELANQPERESPGR